MFASTVAENLRSHETFCNAYYEPIRSVLRLVLRVRQDDVDELTQSFFAKVLEQDLLARYKAERGLFRWWLFTTLKNHVRDSYRRERRYRTPTPKKLLNLRYGFDLRLMSSLSDVGGIPKSGTNLVIVAKVKDVLYFRILDADGKVVVDTDETRLRTQARLIEDLKRQLESLRPPHEITRSEKDRVIAAVTSIVGHTIRYEMNVQHGPRDLDLVDDPDSLYALYVLNVTLQKMRSHCESSGRPEIWTLFERWFLAEAHDRPRSEIAEGLHALFPDEDRQFLWNRLTTAKRIFQRILPEAIPPSLSSCARPEERFQEWKEIFRTSRLGRQNRLHLAFCVNSVPPSDASEELSINLAAPTDSFRDYPPEPLTATVDDDELQILLSFRLSMPLDFYLGGLPDEVRPRRQPSGNNLAASPRPAPPLSLLTLITPGPEPRPEEEEIDRVALFQHIKRRAKAIHEDAGNAIPGGIIQVIYNLAIVLALVQCRTRITDLEDAALIKNWRWVLSRPWLDKRLDPIFRRGLQLLEASPPPPCA